MAADSATRVPACKNFLRVIDICFSLNFSAEVESVPGGFWWVPLIYGAPESIIFLENIQYVIFRRYSWATGIESTDYADYTDRRRSTKSHEIAPRHDQLSFVCFRGSFCLARQSLQSRRPQGALRGLLLRPASGVSFVSNGHQRDRILSATRRPDGSAAGHGRGRRVSAFSLCEHARR